MWPRIIQTNSVFVYSTTLLHVMTVCYNMPRNIFLCVMTSQLLLMKHRLV